jgi:putative SOS response-associated peptidase YedK
VVGIESFIVAQNAPGDARELVGQGDGEFVPVQSLIHDRMPVILPSEDWPLWLSEEEADVERLKATLAPYPGKDMTMWPVSQRVGNVRNNDPSLIEAVV